MLAVLFVEMRTDIRCFTESHAGCLCHLICSVISCNGGIS